MLPLFTYGTLRPGGANFYLIEASLVDQQPATMAGLVLWDMGNYPMAVEGLGRVRGDLLTIAPEHYDAVLRRLDELEAVDPAAPTAPGGAYWRARRSAIVPGCGASAVEAWVYLGDPALAEQGRRIHEAEWQARNE